MRRRDFLLLATATATATAPAWPLAGLAQETAKVPRVAIVIGFPIADIGSAAGLAAFNNSFTMTVFLPELGRLGFVEGRTVSFERYGVPGSGDAQLARAIVASRPDLIVIAGPSAMALALLALTTTIPILVGTADPVGSEVVRDLAPTGRNLAVVSGSASSDFEGKNLGLLAEAVPSARRVAYINTGPDGQIRATGQQYLQSASEAAARLILSLTTIIAREAGDEAAFRDAFAQAMAAKVDVIQFGRASVIANASPIIAGLALDNRMPAISDYPAFSRAGGLMSYGQRDGDQYQEVAKYAAQILGGADPGKLPVVQPTLFDLVINLKTAKAIGVTIPPSLLAQATEVIQ